METDALPRPGGRGCLGLRSSEHRSGAGHTGDGHGIKTACAGASYLRGCGQQREHIRALTALGCLVALEDLKKEEEDEVRV